METVDVTGVQPDWMASLCGRITILEEVVGHLWGTCHLARTGETKDKEIENKSVVLEDEGGELKPANQTVCICVGHIYNHGQ